MSTHQDEDPYEVQWEQRSPGLEPVKIKLGPDNPTPSFVPQQISNSAGTKGKKARRKVRASQGDVVLLNFLDPNRPDLAQAAGNHVLPCSSSSDGEESENSDDDIEDLDTKLAAKIEENARNASNARQKAMAKEVVAKNALHDLDNGDDAMARLPPQRKDSNMSTGAGRRSNSDAVAEGLKINGVTVFRPNGPERKTSEPRSIAVNGHRNPSISDSRTSTGNFSTSDSLVTSPISNHLRSPLSPKDRLPAIKNPSSPKSQSNPNSPPSNQTLPSAKGLLADADRFNAEENLRRRQQSFSSASGPSPTFYNGAPSPFNSLGQGSPPTSLDSAPSPREFRGSIVTSPQYAFPRRPSQASETFPPPLHSAATTDSYSSPDPFSPSAHTTATSTTTPSETSLRVSVENGRALPPPSQMIPPFTTPSPAALGPSSVGSKVTLPPPVPTGPSQQQSQNLNQAQGPGQGAVGSYKCTHPGCTAPPFQTQYLLNSHATVHSQSRPHYCPVAGCPRSTTGKGFKRKNEMIRHGLVHESPGYVCPFCPDREHKYPRPDNLQRHVRVHHSDVDRGDSRLRVVLERRGSSSGNRGGRRRRVT